MGRKTNSDIDLQLLQERINNKNKVHLKSNALLKKPKYLNRKIIIDGITFASIKEGRRYSTLKILEKSGKIKDLELQKKFDFIINGFKVCSYVADACYTNDLGTYIVEDTKSEITRKNRAYSIKRKLMIAVFNITISEI